MSFKVIVKERDDGEFDVVSAYNIEELILSNLSALELAQEFQNKLEYETIIIDCEVITDVIINVSN